MTLISSSRDKFRAALMGIVVLPMVEIPTQRVDAVVPADYPTVSQAVMRAQDNNFNGRIEILIKPGIYRENVVVNRSNIFLMGSGSRLTTIVGAGPEPTLRVDQTSGFFMSGFTVTSANGLGNGLELFHSKLFQVNNNTFTGNVSGLVLTDSRFGKLNRNLVTGNSGEGLLMNLSEFVSSSENKLTRNGRDGILTKLSNSNWFQGNDVSSNLGVGIYLIDGSRNFVVRNQVLANGGHGVELRGQVGSAVLDNVVKESKLSGLYMDQTARSQVFGNHFFDNGEWGIYRELWTDDDYSREGDMQAPPGDNKCVGNFLGAWHEG